MARQGPTTSLARRTRLAESARLITSVARRFRLEPGQQLAWSDSVPVGNVGLGPAKLYTSVSIVFLEGCSSKYGCHHTSVSSQFVPFEVVPRSQEAR